ncbi:MAG TPA: ankyrin repeat domain-containing protein [Acetobacteraceae bacterium]|nr:ankyrin repeat domain-containing protein [Acetobacteraceae bacterium]
MRRLIRFAMVAGVAAVPGWAWAQGYGNGAGPGQQIGVPTPQRNKPQAPVQAPPPAIPGAQSNPALVAPPNQPPSDLSPNAALFDAINRGDSVAARDALNRGADLNARNVLGMTPIDLSIDLGRNDITFLLLSMRGGSEDAGPAFAATRPAPAAAAHAPPAQRRSISASARFAARAPTVRPAPPRTPPQTAPLFAGNGGAPVPQAGFLGFDPGSAPR